MKARTYIRAFLSVVAAVAIGLMVSSCGDPSPRLTDTNFPEKTNTRVELAPSKANESIRYVYFAEDKVTKTLTQIEYNTGVTTYVFHNKAGKDTEIRSFYKSADGSDKRVMRSLIIMDDDGHSYKSHQVFREDGSLWKQGGRLTDGSYQTLYFFPGTGAIEKRLVSTKEQQLQSEELYTPDGKITEKTVKVSDYELSTTRYAPDGKMVSVINDSKWGSRSGKFFYEDGTTIKMSFSSSSYRIDVYYYDRSGVLTLEVEYFTDSMTTTVYAPGEKAQYKQEWKLVSGTSLCDATFQLKGVEEYWKWGSYRYSKETKQVIQVGPDGKTPTKIVTDRTNSWSNNRTELDFYPDGSVSKEVKYDAQSNPTSTKTYKQGERTLNLKKEFFEKPVFQCLDVPPSKLKEPVEQPQYEYED